MLENNETDCNSRIDLDPRNVALNQVLARCEEKILSTSTTDVQYDGMVFAAPPYESLPTLVAKDPLLRAVDKTIFFNIWIWGKENGSQQAAFPSYDYLEHTCNVARGTIASSIKKLRAHGLLILSRSVRDTGGRYRGNIYIINPEPMSLGETVQLDPDYINFLQEAAGFHNPRHLQKLAEARLSSINENLLAGEDVLDTDPRIQTEKRLAAQEGMRTGEFNKGFFGVSKAHCKALKRKKSSKTDQVQNLNLAKKQLKAPSPNFELGQPSLKFEPSSKCKLDSVVGSSSNIYKNTTTTTNQPNKYSDPFANIEFGPSISEQARELKFFFNGLLDSGLAIPKGMQDLYELKDVNEYIQFLLDELNTAIEAKAGTSYPVKNPSTYLMGMINKALKNQYIPNYGYSKAVKRREALANAARAKANRPIPAAPVISAQPESQKVDPSVIADLRAAAGLRPKRQD